MTARLPVAVRPFKQLLDKWRERLAALGEDLKVELLKLLAEANLQHAHSAHTRHAMRVYEKSVHACSGK